MINTGDCWEVGAKPDGPGARCDHGTMATKTRAIPDLGRPRLLGLLVFLSVAASCTGPADEPGAAQTPPAVVIEGYEVQAFEDYGAQHHVGSTDDVTYRETPPVAGPHSPVPAPCGIHGEPIPEEMMVHTLEHGAVGILFEPTLPRAEIRAIEDLAHAETGPVFSAPHEGLEGQVAVISWGHRMDLERFDEAALAGFIERFAGDAPEGTMGCHDFEDDSFLDTSR